jgi:hypothetical protein
MKEKSTSSFRLDEKVYLTMILVGTMSLLVLGFRYISRHPCPPISLQIQSNTDSFQKGNLISFKAVSAGGNDFTWNFGDGSRNDETAPTVLHKFSNAGTYTVSVTVDGECSEFQTVAIMESPVIDNNILGNTFTGPTAGYVGLPLTFEDLSIKSKSWEWHFEDPVKVDAITKTATHVFNTSGLKTISLMINGRRDLVQSRSVLIVDREVENNMAKAKENHTPKPSSAGKVVYVPTSPTVQPLVNPTQPSTVENTPKKEEEKPKPKAPEVTAIQMEGLLKEVIAGTKGAEDFSSYFCGNLSTVVVYNSNNVTFSAMCASLKELKKKKLKSIKVTLFPNATTNCQQSMIVNVDVKKGFLGLIN